MTRCASTLLILTVASGCASDRYKYVRVQEQVRTGKSDLSPEEQEVEKMLQQAAQVPLASEYFGKMFNTAVLVFEDFDNLTFTVKFANGAATVTRGTDTSVAADYIIPMRKQNCENLLRHLEDGTISDEEAYRIHYVTYVAGIRSLFRVPALYDERVARALDLPNLMHMSLKNEKQYVFPTTTRPASATVANVDGQWLVFDGLRGDPALKMEVTHQQITELASLVFQRGRASSAEPDPQAVADLKKWIDKVTVYRRQ